MAARLDEEEGARKDLEETEQNELEALAAQSPPTQWAPQAQFYLGTLYRYGLWGFERNEGKGSRLITQAAEAKYYPAMLVRILEECDEKKRQALIKEAFPVWQKSQ